MKSFYNFDSRKPPRRRFALGSFLVTAVIVTIGSIRFARKQNKGERIGGAMSLPKVAWLNYALLGWYVFPYFIARTQTVSPIVRRIYTIHLGSFGVRGLVELWMLYRTHSWIPPYGIGHDLFHILLLSQGLETLPVPVSGADRTAVQYLASVRIALVLEIVFAYLFYRATETTTGKAAIYFADDSPVYRTTNLLTGAVVTAAYGDLFRTLITIRRSDHG